jgi:hypothetical protein
VAATNLIGTSSFSSDSSNQLSSAVVMNVPEKPESVPLRGPQTTTSQIHVVVQALEGDMTGGSPILSYEIDYDRGTAEWQELKGFSSNDDSLEFIKTALTISVVYQVRYRAKNVFGWSEYSDTSFVETIMVPDIPEQPVSSELIGTNVVFTWVQPDARGTPIQFYNLQVQS